MKRVFLFLSIISVFLTSCEEHTEIVDVSLKVGHLYCSDGSVINPDSYRGSDKTAVGVIFWVNNGSTLTSDKALVVSLENLPPVVWAEKLDDVNNVSTGLETFDGASNTASIIVWGTGEVINTPGATVAYNYMKHGVSGWFLPSVAEALQISANKSAIYNALRDCNGEDFSHVWYWTSTQDGTGSDTPDLNALSVSFDQGRTTTSNKFNTFAVRPVIAIK